MLCLGILLPNGWHTRRDQLLLGMTAVCCVIYGFHSSFSFPESSRVQSNNPVALQPNIRCFSQYNTSRKNLEIGKGLFNMVMYAVAAFSQRSPAMRS
jgi:hypothetical protein